MSQDKTVRFAPWHRHTEGFMHRTKVHVTELFQSTNSSLKSFSLARLKESTPTMKASFSFWAGKHIIWMHPIWRSQSQLVPTETTISVCLVFFFIVLFCYPHTYETHFICVNYRMCKHIFSVKTLIRFSWSRQICLNWSQLSENRGARWEC